MAFYRRRLPHIYQTQQPVFLTWRLYDSLPLHRVFPTTALNSGQAFDAMDRLLDEARTGAFYLRQPAVADMVVEAIYCNAITLGHYVLHAFVVMPNHVHLLAAPAVALPKLTKSLKGITAKRANAILGLTGKPFWQEESYDHLVRHERELEKIRDYIEGNPVRAGLVSDASEYRWSSAGWAMTQRVPRVACGPGGPPHRRPEARVADLGYNADSCASAPRFEMLSNTGLPWAS
jgi:REP element-mobilizing transposase RayT